MQDVCCAELYSCADHHYIVNDQTLDFMRIRLIILILVTTQVTVFGQIKNSWSWDNSGMYHAALDTLIQIVDKHETLSRLLISGDRLNNQMNLPEKIQWLNLKKIDNGFKSKQVTDQDLYVLELELQVNEDIISVNTIMVTSKQNYGYAVAFRFQPTTRTYEIIGINEVSVNVHVYK